MGAESPGPRALIPVEKASTRTRAAFEVAAHDEGAHVSHLGPGETQLGRNESIKDTARVLGRMFDGIEYRGFDQEAVETLAAYAGVPVWNGLTDAWHPTQMLADVLTVTDHCAKPRAMCGRPLRAWTSCTPTHGCPWASPRTTGTRGSTSYSPTR
jgi:ornithine carbamoyltransferase